MYELTSAPNGFGLRVPSFSSLVLVSKTSPVLASPIDPNSGQRGYYDGTGTRVCCFEAARAANYDWRQGGLESRGVARRSSREPDGSTWELRESVEAFQTLMGASRKLVGSAWWQRLMGGHGCSLEFAEARGKLAGTRASPAGSEPCQRHGSRNACGNLGR